MDRYIIKKFLITFFFALLAMTALVVVVDLSEKTDDFAKTGLTASQILRDYYFGFIPHIDAMLFPLFIFISVIFFTSKMANRSEIIALLSSGITFPRILAPYFFTGLLFSGLLWWANQSLLPHANTKWSTFNAKYIDFNYGGYINTATISNKYFRLDSFSYAGLRYYDTTSKTGSNFFIQQFDSTALKYNLHARGISWDTAKHRNQWLLTGVRIRKINGLRQTITDSSEMHMKFNFKPRDLQKDSYMKERMTTPELNEFIKLEELRGAEDINGLILEKHSRMATPLSVLVLTLIGAIIASEKIRGGSGFHLALGVLICVVYILLGRFAVVFSLKAHFNPVLAAWLPNIAFSALAWILYRRASK